MITRSQSNQVMFSIIGYVCHSLPFAIHQHRVYYQRLSFHRVLSIPACKTSEQTITSITYNASSVEIKGSLGACNKNTIPYTLSFTQTDFPGQLQYAISTIQPSPPFDAIVTMELASDESEGVFGMGVQYTNINVKGFAVPVITSEQGSYGLVWFGMVWYGSILAHLLFIHFPQVSAED